MTARDFIHARAIRSREVLEFVLKNEIAQIEEKHAQYDTLCATAKELEKAGQYEIANVCDETASRVLADLSLIQAMYAYVLTGEGAGLSSADIGVIEALPYLKNR